MKDWSTPSLLNRNFLSGPEFIAVDLVIYLFIFIELKAGHVIFAHCDLLQSLLHHHLSILHALLSLLPDAQTQSFASDMFARPLLTIAALCALVNISLVGAITLRFPYGKTKVRGVGLGTCNISHKFSLSPYVPTFIPRLYLSCGNRTLELDTGAPAPP